MGIASVDLGTTSRPSEPGDPVSAPPMRTLSGYLLFALLLGVIVFFGVVRFGLRDIPLERDEGEFAYGGQLILQGAPLYDNLYTLKLPGTYAAYAGIMAALGQTRAGIHIGLIFVNAATTLLVFLLTIRLFGQLAGLIAGISYAALSGNPSVAGFAGHATHFVVLCAMGGLCLLLEALDRDRSWLLFCSGLLFGMAFLMKQPGIFFLVFAGLYLVWRRLWGSRDWRKLVRELVVLGAAAVLPFLITCLLTWHSGTFQKFWFWTFSYAARYGTNASLHDGLATLRHNSVDVIGPAAGIWVIAGLGLTALLWNRKARSNSFLLIALSFLSFLAVSPGLFYRPHYFILMLPAVAILAGVAVGCATEMLLNRTGSRFVAAIPVLMFLAAFSLTIYRQRYYFFVLTPNEGARATYGQNPFPEALEIANYIENNTSPASTVAILGSEPEIYFYSHRRAATGHVCTYALLEPQYGEILQKQMEQEIESARPDILVLVNDPASWIAFPNTLPLDDLLKWAKGYIRQSYTVTGVAEMDKYSTEYVWGERARRHPLAMARNIVVLKRNPS